MKDGIRTESANQVIEIAMATRLIVYCDYNSEESTISSRRGQRCLNVHSWNQAVPQAMACIGQGITTRAVEWRYAWDSHQNKQLVERASMKEDRYRDILVDKSSFARTTIWVSPGRRQSENSDWPMAINSMNTLLVSLPILGSHPSQRTLMQWDVNVVSRSLSSGYSLWKLTATGQKQISTPPAHMVGMVCRAQFACCQVRLPSLHCMALL